MGVGHGCTRGRIALIGLSVLALAAAREAAAQRLQPPEVPAPGIDGPPPPAAPAVVTRDERGRATVRATRIAAPPVLDGRLDEEFYQTVPAIADFVQQEPREGAPATDATEAWIFFDDKNVYVSLRCWYADPTRIVANAMARDSQTIFQNDNVGVAFDTFYDRRNGVFFQTNALGAIRDGAINDETNVNYDWNTEWDAKSRRFERGWTTEMAIPFKSLRYRKGAGQIWGFTIQRIVRGTNEASYIQRMPQSFGLPALFKLSAATTLVGMEVPPGGLNLAIKPYVISDVTTNRLAAPPVSNDLGGTAGFDAKYGISKSLTFDFTYNTDFAQVEVDDQQVNLTRFSLFYPEKREFFLEGQGIFAFGGASGQARAGSGGPGETPLLFYSRRIGLENGETVPIEGGGRLTGRAGRYTIGLLDIRTGQPEQSRVAPTNFSVVRVKRDILRRSSVGVLATRRADRDGAAPTNQVAGVDANLAFFQNVQINAYYAHTHTSGLSGDAASYRADFQYNGDRYGMEVDHLKIGDAFHPEIGYLRRRDARRNFGLFRFSPRPKALPGVRKLSYEASLDHIENGAGQLETAEAEGVFKVMLNNGDTATAQYLHQEESLRTPFEVGRGVFLPVGRYPFGEGILTYQLGPQRKVSGATSLTAGRFFSGTRTGAAYQGRVELSKQLAVEPRLSVDRIDLPEGRFTATLLSGRTTYNMTPRMFVAALLQYNSGASSFGANIRFRWEYEPGSDLFVVFGEGRDTASPSFPRLQNRSFVVKYTRLFRF
jgi:hypothetical protein